MTQRNAGAAPGKIEDAVTRLCAAAEQRDAHLVEWLDPAIGAASIDDLERESA